MGGGIRTLDDFDRVLKCGADKVSVNSGAIADPSLIGAAAKKYGDQCVVLSMDVKRVDGQFRLFAKGGREDTGIDAMDWAVRGVDDGAGEIVLNSIDTDGVKGGFDLEMLDALAARVDVPIIASGGAGQHGGLRRALHAIPGMDAGLAASIFHTQQVDIKELKRYLRPRAWRCGCSVRLTTAEAPSPVNLYMEKERIMELKFDEKGLIPAIVQDHYTKEVLTLAYMNAESLAITIDEGRTCFWSRSRQELWRKGETSGNVQHVVSITADCDGDALVVEVVKDGPACHTGAESCFFQPVYLIRGAQAPSAMRGCTT